MDQAVVGSVSHNLYYVKCDPRFVLFLVEFTLADGVNH